jgi:hypothetical protein
MTASSYRPVARTSLVDAFGAKLANESFNAGHAIRARSKVEIALDNATAGSVCPWRQQQLLALNAACDHACINTHGRRVTSSACSESSIPRL